MRSIFIILFFVIGYSLTFGNDNSESPYRKPDVKHMPMTTASVAPAIDYSNGVLTIVTSSNVSRVTIKITDESGATIYRCISPLSSSTHRFSVSLLPGSVYTVTATINGSQYYDIIPL